MNCQRCGGDHSDPWAAKDCLQAQLDRLRHNASHFRCSLHAGDASNAWGCPGCVADLRAERDRLAVELAIERKAALDCNDALFAEREAHAQTKKELVIEAKSALLCNDALASARAAIADLEAERDHYRTVFANASDQRESAREELAQLRERLNK